MKKRHSQSYTGRLGLFLALLFLMLLCAGCSRKGVIKIPFSYQSGAQDEESYLYYSDSFFDNPSTQYNPSLATASLSFAIASFSSTKESEYTHRYQNIEAVLEKTGFTDLYVNEDYTKKPEADTLGVVIARKALGSKTLVMVGIRGANYESEWASNVTIGDGIDSLSSAYHQGFYEASEIILAALKSYVESQNLSGELMLWMHGYSRAGASCNLAAGRLDEYLRDGAAFLGEGVSLKREDFYAYCFEAPRGVVYDESRYPKSELFSNIFCIVNQNDPVPKVVMDAFSFTRYGREIILPDTLTDADFAATLKKLKAEYGTLRSFGDWGTYQVSQFRLKTLGAGEKLINFVDSPKVQNWPQSLYLDELLALITTQGIQERSNYTYNMQEGLREIFELLYARRNTTSTLKDLAVQMAREVLLSGDLEVLVDDIFHKRDYLFRDLNATLGRALSRMGVEAETDVMVHSLTKLLFACLEALEEAPDLLFSLFSMDNIKAVASAHYPELCLAYMRIMDPLYTKDPVQASTDGAYYLLRAPADTDVTVYQGESIVAGIVNQSPLASDSLLACGIRREEICIYLPVQESYRVQTGQNQDIRLLLVEPGLLRESEISIEFHSEESGFSFEVPAVSP